MDTVLKVAHCVGLARFLGSLLGHILPGFALLMTAKYMILGAIGLAVFKPVWRRDKTNPVEVRP